MITKVSRRHLIGLSFIICHLSFSAALTSCADYNETDSFKAEPDPAAVLPYTDLGAVKSYIDKSTYPNMALGATVRLTEFNKQELQHAAIVANFDNVSFGTSLMSGTIVNAKGVMNFLDMNDLLAHVQDIGYEVYGSPLFANANQADEWLVRLTAPIEVAVDYVEGKEVNYNEMTTFEGTAISGKPTIEKYDGQNVLKIPTLAKVNIIEGFDVDPSAKYTTTFWVRADKDATFTVNFSGNVIPGAGKDGKWTFKAGKWTKIVVEAQSAPEVSKGYLTIENTRSGVIYVQKAQVGYYPDNHRQQTAKEISDTINYAINTWCDGFMEINKGRINAFDLIDEPIDVKSQLENGMFDLKHSTEKIFWQDILGSENYAPVVSKAASEAYQRYEGKPEELRFFISETGLEDAKKLESLNYWIKIWDAKGAKIDGINAKLNLVYSEDATVQAANEASLNTLLSNLAATGKLIRLSNFDIKYQDATGANVTVDKISAVQRQKLADYYGYVIKCYMAKIPKDKQAGMCKSNLVDTTSDPVGLWSYDSKKDWVRNATYKAFCDALSGK